MKYNLKFIVLPEETVQKEFGSSKRLQIVVLTLAVAVNLLFAATNIVLAIFLFFFGCMYYWYLLTAKHYALTDKRFLLVDSFPKLDVIAIDYAQLTNIQMKQNIIEKICGWGTLILFTTSDKNGASEIHLSLIDNPQVMKQELEHARDRNK